MRVDAIAIHQHGRRAGIEVDGVAELAVEVRGAPARLAVQQRLRQLDLLRLAALRLKIRVADQRMTQRIQRWVA